MGNKLATRTRALLHSAGLTVVDYGTPAREHTRELIERWLRHVDVMHSVVVAVLLVLVAALLFGAL